MISITFADFKKQHTENQRIIILFAYNHTCMIVCEIIVRNIGISDYTIAEDEDIKINKFYCIFCRIVIHTKLFVLHIILIISILYVLLLRFNILLKCSRMSNGITDYGKLSIY